MWLATSTTSYHSTKHAASTQQQLQAVYQERCVCQQHVKLTGGLHMLTIDMYGALAGHVQVAESFAS